MTHLPLSGPFGTEDRSRNHISILSSDVVVALPGGDGTSSELQLAPVASSGSDGIHDELSITSILSVHDPEVIRHEQRLAAGLASINGIDISDLAWMQDLGRKVVAFWTRLTGDAIRELRAAN